MYNRSVFLRKLEYYRGILVLTTNLIDCIDDAFESRISYQVHFRALTKDDRIRIWTDFINDMNQPSNNKTRLLSHVGVWADADINGRQIRNVITMAENLALSDEQDDIVTPAHIEQIIQNALDFSTFNNRTATGKKK
jgi:AAA+ superfamily predicted ATPase